MGSPDFGAGLPSGAPFSVYGGAPDAAVPTMVCDPGLPVFSLLSWACRVSESAGFGVESPGGAGTVPWLDVVARRFAVLDPAATCQRRQRHDREADAEQRLLEHGLHGISDEKR